MGVFHYSYLNFLSCAVARGNIPRCHFEIEGDDLICTANEPSYREALSSPAKGEWMDAMKDELSSMDKNSM